MKICRIFAAIVLMTGICLMGFSGIRLLEAKQAYQEGDALYTGLGERVRKTLHNDEMPQPPLPQYDYVSAESESGEQLSNEQDVALVYVPPIEIDFETLKEINEDAVAWIYCPDTKIDYPVIRATEYSYYLNRLPDGTQNTNGTLFIDFNNASDFSDPLTVIYGHNMKSGAMFGSLDEYKNQRYYDENPYMYLYTEKGNYRIDLIYGCVIGAGQWRERAFMYPVNLNKLLLYAEINTTFESSIRYEEGDSIVALATCSYEFNDARYVVLGVLRRSAIIRE